MSVWRPEREVQIVAGTPPGGGLDRSARALLKAIEARRLLDVPMKVNNVAGDGGRNAWKYLDGFAGDPHVLCISSSNLATDRLLGARSYDHEVSFTPLAILYTSTSRSSPGPIRVSRLPVTCSSSSGPPPIPSPSRSRPPSAIPTTSRSQRWSVTPEAT